MAILDAIHIVCASQREYDFFKVNAALRGFTVEAGNITYDDVTLSALIEEKRIFDPETWSFINR